MPSAGQRAEKRDHLQIHLSLQPTLQPPAVKVCTLLAGHPPRSFQGYLVGGSSLCCAEDNLTCQGSSERLNPTSTRSGNTIISPELANLTVTVPESLNVAVPWKIRLSVGGFRYLMGDMGFWRWEVCCLCPLFPLKKKMEVPLSSWKRVWLKPFVFGEHNPNLMYNFLYVSASQQSNIFVSWKRSFSLSQQVWLRGQSITDIATTILL